MFPHDTKPILLDAIRHQNVLFCIPAPRYSLDVILITQVSQIPIETLPIHSILLIQSTRRLLKHILKVIQL